MKKSILLISVLFSSILSAAEPYSASFANGKWNRSDFISVKSPRLRHLSHFVQKEDHIINDVPEGLSDETVYKKYSDASFTSMLLKKELGLGTEIAASTSFDHRMAPGIIIAFDTSYDSGKRPEYREHYEIVLYDDGLNVWHHTYKDGRPAWFKAAGVKLRKNYQPKTRYKLSVRLEKTPAGGKRMSVSCAGLELVYEDPSIPEKFRAGISGCEGRTRFYDFSVKPVIRKK